MILRIVYLPPLDLCMIIMISNILVPDLKRFHNHNNNHEFTISHYISLSNLLLIVLTVISSTSVLSTSCYVHESNNQSNNPVSECDCSGSVYLPTLSFYHLWINRLCSSLSLFTQVYQWLPAT